MCFCLSIKKYVLESKKKCNRPDKFCPSCRNKTLICSAFCEDVFYNLNYLTKVSTVQSDNLQVVIIDSCKQIDCNIKDLDVPAGEEVFVFWHFLVLLVKTQHGNQPKSYL